MWKPIGGLQHGHSQSMPTGSVSCSRLVPAASHVGNPAPPNHRMSHIDGEGKGGFMASPCRDYHQS